jgi:hypothetical protein
VTADQGSYWPEQVEVSGIRSNSIWVLQELTE